MGLFDSALKEKREEKLGSQFGGGWGIPDLIKETKAEEPIIPEALKEPIAGFDIALKAPSTAEMSQKQDILLNLEEDYESLNVSIGEDYKQYQELSKQLDDLEIEIQEAPEEMRWNLTQKFNEVRDIHNKLVDKLQTDTAQQKKIYQEYNSLRESYDKDIDIYNKWAEAKNREPEPKELEPVDIGEQFTPASIAQRLKGKTYRTGEKEDPTWGNVIYHSLKSGLGQYQASLVNLFRLIDMGVTKLTDPIQDIIPIDDEKVKAFKEKYGEDPTIDTTDMLTKIVEESEKIAIESAEQAESKQWLKKALGTGLKAVPQITGAIALGAGMPIPTGLAAAKLGPPLAEITTRVTQMVPFGAAAAGGGARQIELEYEALGEEAPYWKMVAGGALIGAGEMASELPIFIGVTRLLGKGGVKLVNEGAKTLVDKYGKLGIEFIKNLALQSFQEGEMVFVEKSIKQSLGLPTDWSIEPLTKEVGEACYGGLCMAVVMGGLGGSVVGSTKIADKTAKIIDNVIKDKGDIKEAIRKIAEVQMLIPKVPEAETLAYAEEIKPIPEELKNDYLKIIDYDIDSAKDRTELELDVRNDIPISEELQTKYPDLMKKIPEAKFAEIGIKPFLPEEREKPMVRGINFEENPEVYRVVAKADDIIEKSKLKIKYPFGEIDYAIQGLKDAMMDKTLTTEQTRQIREELTELTETRKDIATEPTEYTEIKIPEAKMLPEIEKPMVEPKKEDFEALKTTDKNKELFYEKYDKVYTETKTGYDRLIDERVTELKEEGFKGVEKGGLKRTEEGEVIGAYPAISLNPKWYRDFYAQNKKIPSNKDLRGIAEEQLSEGHTEDYGEVPADTIFIKLDAQLETLDALLTDVKEGDYSFEVTGNVSKLNKELGKLTKEIEKVKKEYEAKLEKQIIKSKKRYDQLTVELDKQKKISTREDVKKIKDLETEKLKTKKDIEKLKARLEEAKIKIPKPRPEGIKKKVREITGQIPEKIEIAERDILRLVLRGEAKGARRAFAEAKKEGIFEQKEHFAEVVGRAKERQAKRDEIGKVKDILKKTDLKKLRPERQKAIKDIIDEIDLAKMTERTERKLTSRLDYIKENPDNLIPQEKIDELARLNKKPISDLTAEDIALIKDSILHEINLNKLKNKIIFGKEIKEAAEELKESRANVLEGKDTIKDDSIIDSGETEHKTLWQRIKRIWGINSLNPEVICEELDNRDHGVIMKYVFKGLDNGITDKLGVKQEADAWLSKELEGIDLSKWSKAFQGNRKNIDFQEIKLSDGRTLKITKGERISFLLHEKNNKNLAHLTEGGFRFSDNLSRKYKLTEENLEEIINSATTEEVKVSDTLWKFFNEFIKPKLNEISMELNGWEIATEDNYYPIRTVALDRIRDALKAQRTFDNRTLEGLGIFKERTNAKNALIIEDAFTVTFKHLEATSSYIGLAKPLRYAKLVLEDTAFQENVMRTYGKDYINNLKKYLQEMEEDSVNLDNADKLTAELINKLDSAILGMHIFVAFKQPVSYLVASTEIDTRYLAKATIKKNDYEEIRKYSPQLRQRLDGHITRELGELGNVGKVRQLFLHKSPLNSKILVLIRKFDAFTIGKIWVSAKIEVKEQNPDISQEEFFKKVTERTEEIVRRTQPTWHTKDRSEMARNKSIFIRLLTKYTSQRNKNRIVLKRSTLKYNRGKHRAWDRIVLMKNYSIVLLVNALLINAIDELRRKAYGRKSRTIWQQVVGAIGTALSNFYFVGDAFSSLASKIQKGTYAGYDTGNVVYSYVDNAIDGITELKNTIEQLYTKERYKTGTRKGALKWKTSALRALDRNAYTLLALKGLPYNNVRNIIAGTWKMAGDKEEIKQMPMGEIDLDKIFRTIEKLPSGEIDLDKILGS